LKTFQKALNHVSFQDNPSNGKTAGRINGYTLDVVVRVKQKSNKRKNKSGADTGGIQLPNNNNAPRGAGRPKNPELTDPETELEVEILGPVVKQNYNEETGTYEYKLLQPPSGNELTLKIESRQKFEEENGIVQNDLTEDEDASLDDFDDEGMKYYVLRHRILTRACELDVYK
jgi:hypothetical protein